MADGTLIITNGTKRVNMLGGRKAKSGIYLHSWKPGRLQLKKGGYWHDSPVSDLRSAVDHRWATIVDTFDYKMAGGCTDDVVYYSQEYDRLLIQAVEYWELKQSRYPVWIEKRGSNESNTSYAIVYGFKLPNDNNPFGQPFWNFSRTVQDDMKITIEHGPWQDNIPGEYNDTPAGAVLCNNYLPNPSFESFPAPPPVLPTGWLLRSSPTLVIENEDPTYIRTGDRSVGFNNTSGLDRGIAAVLTANDTVFDYTVDVYVVSGQAFLAAYDPADDPRSGAWAVTGGTGWQTLSFTHMGYGTANTEVRIGTTAEQGGEVYFDDISACRYYGDTDWLVETAFPLASGDDATISGAVSSAIVFGADGKIKADDDMSSPHGWRAMSEPKMVAVLSPTKLVVGHVADQLVSNYLIQACVVDITPSTKSFTSGSWYTLDTVENNINNPPESSMIELSSSTFLYAWYQIDIASVNGYVKAVVGSVSGTTITVGSQYAPSGGFGGNTARDISVARLSDTSAVVVATKSNSTGRAWVVTISGTTITWGTGVDFATIGAEAAVEALSATKFAVFYEQNNDAYVKIGNVSGTTITFGSAYQVSVDLSGFTDNLAMTAPSDSLLIFAWQESVGFSKYKYVRAGSIAGTVVTLGSTVVVGDSTWGYNSLYNSLDTVDASTFLYRYDISGIGADSNAVRLCTVSGTTITLGSPVDTAFWGHDQQVRYIGNNYAFEYKSDETVLNTMFGHVMSLPTGLFSWNSIDLVGTVLTVGDLSSTEYAFGIRFNDVDIPQGAIIHNAFVRFNNVVATNIGVTAQIWGEDDSYPDIFTTVNDFTSRPLTPQTVPWVPAVNYANNQYIDTPDIATIITRITSRPDWVSGNDLALFVYDPTATTDKTIQVSSYDSTYFPRPEPELIVTYSLGAEAGEGGVPDSADPFFVANKMNLANLTHIFTNISASFSDNLLDAVNNWTIQGTGGDDYTVFGISTSNPNYGPFNSLVFNLVEAAIDQDGTNNLTWEYWNGAWTPLTISADHTDGGIGPLSNTDLGVLSVHWEPPSDWATTSVNGVTAWWVRLYVDSVGSWDSDAIQDASNIVYSVTWPFIEVKGRNIGGDIDSLAELVLANKTYNTVSEKLGYNRVVMGLRDLDRGADFNGFINVSDVQQPTHITAAVPGSNTVWDSLNEVPTGRYAKFTSGAGIALPADEITITIAQTHALQYIGRFRIFMRVWLNGAAVYNNLVISTGGESYVEVSDSTTNYYVIDFGEMVIPSGSYAPGDVIDDLVFTLQLGCAGAVTYYRVVDMILMPTDQAYYDFYPTLSSDFLGINKDSEWTQVDLDSVRNPRRVVRSLFEKQENNAVIGQWVPRTATPLALIPNRGQKLWIMGWDSWNSSTDEYPLGANPNGCATAQMKNIQRYTGMRGNR